MLARNAKENKAKTNFRALHKGVNDEELNNGIVNPPCYLYLNCVKHTHIIEQEVPAWMLIIQST